jgi:hypothetical protein
MFNNTTLEVVIGLIFIFLLYSLLATAIQELIATIFAYRSRMLERGLEQMLDGKNYSYYWWDKVVNFFRWLSYKSKLSKVDKSLSKNTKFDRHVVSKIRTEFFSKPGVKQSLPGEHFKDVTVKRVKLDQKSKLFAANITSHPLYKRAAQNNLLYKKPAYLNADTFSDIMINILGELKTTDSNSPVLMKNISEYVDKHVHNNQGLVKILKIYIGQANGDLQRFKMILESWYDDTMERVSGWYKKQTNRILVFIGFVLAIIFNVSTIESVKYLSSNKVARDAMIQNASAFVNKNLIEKDTLQPNSGTDAKKSDQIQQRIRQIGQIYNDQIFKNDSIMGFGWGDYGYSEDIRNWKASKSKGGMPTVKNTFQKSVYVFIRTITNFRLLFGFLFTAIAISLGAPFWFDLLNKFMNLRNAGTKPESSNSAGGDSKTPGLNKPTSTNPKGFA